MAEQRDGDTLRRFQVGETDYDIELWSRGRRQYVDVYESDGSGTEPVFEGAGNGTDETVMLAADFLGVSFEDLNEAFWELEA